jgi:hypothetical protein
MDTKQIMLNKAAVWRGGILNGVIMLERIIDAYLACYFCNDPNKRDELNDLLFSASAGSGMNFEPKRVVFAILFQKHKKDFYKENKKFFDLISSCIKHRNVIAHYLLDTSPEAIAKFSIDKKLPFIKYKEVTENVYYSDSQLNDIAMEIEYCVSFANKLLEEVY